MLKIQFFIKKLIVTLGLTLTAISVTQQAQAANFTYQGDTTNQPIWRRVAPGNPPTLISGERDGTLGMSVPYNVFDFIVNQSGTYTISGTSGSNSRWDIFLALYQDSFNLNQQLNNVLIASTTTTGDTVTFNRQLTSKRKYFLVTTGRRVADFGIFTNTISGSGRVIPIPESDAIAPILAVSAVTLLSIKFKTHA
ncbi:PEP-CTERM sorting domain-containing protein [Nostoc sp. FACHB-87]|uniref:PEP-CTERM sorting domain-containing protein n=1 Tax=Nostocaceae TaxID=1162 RepID=UPI001689A17A|nr:MULTISPECIES: PEP-CTERM sorting domain-containing protein [Nostocaceae]MBD2456431.1 PEP-CTERM sorting domain-containing protein [Nostoc sp. FACHB-87]MBD2474026.1 PEP-CTERM sorting domain-containing protein [Anabaena sp. FACHB-83]